MPKITSVDFYDRYRIEFSRILQMEWGTQELDRDVLG